MVERTQAPYSAETSTARINHEVVDEAQERRVETAFDPGERRTFEPTPEGVEEKVVFHMTEYQLVDGNPPVPFEARMDGDAWVIETPMFKGEQWRIPLDTEFTIRMDGMYIRGKEDVGRDISPMGPIPFPRDGSPVLQMMMQQARDAGQGHPSLSFLAHESISNQGGNLLTLANTGRDVSRTETVTTGTPVVTNALEMPEPTEVITHPAVVEDREPETTQVVNMEEVIAEGQTIETPTEAKQNAPYDAEQVANDWEAEGGATTSGSQVSQEKVAVEAIQPVDAEPEPEEDPLAGVPERLKIRGRLDNMTTDQILAAYAEEQSAQEKASEEERQDNARQRRLELEKEAELPDAIDKILTYVREEIESMRSSTTEAFFDDNKGVAIAIKQIFEQGSSPAHEQLSADGAHAAAQGLYVKFGEYITDFEQMRKAIEDYFQAEEDVFKAQDRELSEEETGKRKIRQDVVGAMEKLDQALEKVDRVNRNSLESARAIVDKLGRAPGRKYNKYDDLPEFPNMYELGNALREANGQLRQMAESLQEERTRAITEVLAELDAIKAIRDKLAEATKA